MEYIETFDDGPGGFASEAGETPIDIAAHR